MHIFKHEKSWGAKRRSRGEERDDARCVVRGRCADFFHDRGGAVHKMETPIRIVCGSGIMHIDYVSQVAVSRERGGEGGRAPAHHLNRPLSGPCRAKLRVISNRIGGCEGLPLARHCIWRREMVTYLRACCAVLPRRVKPPSTLDIVSIAISCCFSYARMLRHGIHGLIRPPQDGGRTRQRGNSLIAESSGSLGMRGGRICAAGDLGSWVFDKIISEMGQGMGRESVQ